MNEITTQYQKYPYQNRKQWIMFTHGFVESLGSKTHGFQNFYSIFCSPNLLTNRNSFKLIIMDTQLSSQFSVISAVSAWNHFFDDTNTYTTIRQSTWLLLSFSVAFQMAEFDSTNKTTKTCCSLWPHNCSTQELPMYLNPHASFFNGNLL